MNYDYIPGVVTRSDWGTTPPREGSLAFHKSATGLSCAFPSVRGAGTRDNEGLAWRELCFVLTRQKMAKKPLVFPSTENELVTQLLVSCPYAKCVAEAKSNHGNYKSYIWIIQQ
jgi:hypothetical protein